MPMETFKAVVKKKEGIQVEASARGFKVTLDEPESLGGTNTGMNPVELLLCSLGACQAIVAGAFAGQLGINLEDFWVELEGDLDTDGFLGLNDKVRKGFQNIRFNMHVKSDASEEKVKELVEFIEKTCPVGDSIDNGVKFDKATFTIEK